MPNSLFVCPNLWPATDAEPKIVTPLGSLTLDAEFDGVLIGDLKPSTAYLVERGGHLLNWTLDGVTAELLLCRPQLALPAGMAVDDCWVGVWRLRTSLSGERPEFSCRWEPGYHWTGSGPESGEGLDAKTWGGGTVKVTVGTVDAEWLAGHARTGLLPHRWADLLGWSYGGITPDVRTGKIDPVMYLDDGFRLVLPALEAGEQCQVQFVVAWVAAPNSEDADEFLKNDASTWYAVDQRPEDILAGAGCL